MFLILVHERYIYIYAKLSGQSESETTFAIAITFSSLFMKVLFLTRGHSDLLFGEVIQFVRGNG